MTIGGAYLPFLIFQFGVPNDLSPPNRSLINSKLLWVKWEGFLRVYSEYKTRRTSLFYSNQHEVFCLIAKDISIVISLIFNPFRALLEVVVWLWLELCLNWERCLYMNSWQYSWSHETKWVSPTSVFYQLTTITKWWSTGDQINCTQPG